MGKAGKIIKRGAAAAVTGGLSEFAQKNPYGVPVRTNPVRDAVGRVLGFERGEDSTLGGTFSISPEEVSYNKKLILDNGDAQSGMFAKEGTEQDALRKQRRAEMASVLTGIADKQFSRAIPGLAEDANAGGVYTGTGFSEALARERAMNTEDLQGKIAEQGLTDLDAELGFRNSALGQRSSAADSALSRQFSLEDFIRSANVAKATGQALQPKSDGKAGTGSMLQGIGSLAKFLV